VASCAAATWSNDLVDSFVHGSRYGAR